jgi:uncharacterized protein (DUF1778 family)
MEKEKRLIMIVAKVSNMSMSEFMLKAAVEKSEEILNNGEEYL